MKYNVQPDCFSWQLWINANLDMIYKLRLCSVSPYYISTRWLLNDSTEMVEVLWLNRLKRIFNTNTHKDRVNRFGHTQTGIVILIYNKLIPIQILPFKGPTESCTHTVVRFLFGSRRDPFFSDSIPPTESYLIICKHENGKLIVFTCFWVERGQLC